MIFSLPQSHITQSGSFTQTPDRIKESAEALSVFGAGPDLAPALKPSWNGCQQAKESPSIKTKFTFFFAWDYCSLLTSEAL